MPVSESFHEECSSPSKRLDHTLNVVVSMCKQLPTGIIWTAVPLPCYFDVVRGSSVEWRKFHLSIPLSACLSPLAGPQTLLGGPHTLLGGPQTPPTSPQTPPAGPQTPPV